jgi:hypothetical protein
VQLPNYTGKNLSSSKIVLTLSTQALAPNPRPGVQPSRMLTFMPTSNAGPMLQLAPGQTGPVLDRCRHHRFRVRVSLSRALPRAFASRAILPLAACGLVACSAYRPPLRAYPVVPSFRLFVWRCRRSTLSAGFRGSAYQSLTKMLAPSHALLAQAHELAWACPS